MPELVRQGILAENLYLRCLLFFRNETAWNRWALGALLALGVGHILSGIIFFFAFNWNDLSAFTKFAIVNAGIVVSVLLWLILRLDKPLAQAFGISATVLVGVMLAVFGQVYQTPAATHTPFTLWAMLTIPFILASRSLAHWTVWLAIALVAATAYIDEVIEPTGESAAELAYILLGGAMLLLAVTHHLLSRYLGKWAEAGWFTAILVATGAAFLVVRYSIGLFDEGSWISLLLPLVLLPLGFGYFYLRGFSIAAMAILIAALAFLIAETGLKTIFTANTYTGDDSFVGMVFIAALWMIAVTTVTALCFRHIYQKFASQQPVSDLDISTPTKTSGNTAQEAFGIAPAALEKYIATRPEGTAWYMELFLAIAGFITAVFIGLFFGLLFAITFGLENEYVFLTVGLTVFGIGLFLRYRHEQSFLRHLLNTTLMGGGGLALIAVGIITENIYAIAIVGILLGLVPLFLIQDRIIEFLMVIGITVFIALILEEANAPYPFICLSVISTSLGVIALSTPLWKRVLTAAGVAFLLCIPIYAIFAHGIGGGAGVDIGMTSDWISRAASLLITLGAVLFLNFRIGNAAPFRPSPIILIPLLIAIALMPVGSAAALLAVLAGYILGNRVIAVVGICLQIYFIFLFYYDMQITLLEKSGLLAGAGIILVSLWGWLQRKGALQS